MSLYPELLTSRINLYGQNHWLVTGSAGFIGSHLTEALLSLGQRVTGLDDLSTGHEENINAALNESGHPENFRFIHGSITDIDTCMKASEGVDYVLHHAALASVTESLSHPVKYNSVNVSGFVNILESARQNHIKRVVYASSSAVYGDDNTMPKTEDIIGKFLSPYALTKYINEVWAEFYSRVYNLESTGLRYFNVFGKRQDPNGAYAAVIPKWISAVNSNNTPIVYGTGEASRDFCPVQNVVLANILAALEPEANSRVFNIGCGEKTNLNDLLAKIYRVFAPDREIKALHESPRDGDILHSSASIKLAQEVLKYSPVIYLEEGLKLLHE